MPALFGFMALAPRHSAKPRVSDLSTLVRQTLVIVGMQGKALAHAMDLSESHLSRQLNEQGLNLARLVNVGATFWRQMLKPLTEMVGLTREDVLQIFGAESDVDRDERELKQDEQIAELQRQLAEVLRRLSEPAEDVNRKHVA